MKADHQTNTTNRATPQSNGGRLGTFAGVFTPSILTILGIILFLRLGYVTGSGGVGRALLIIAVANLITILTSQSLAAIATNLKVKGGGDYYLISRTLGMEFGGAIGIVLYLAQSVSVAFYCIGFAEALTALLGPDGYSSVAIAIAAVLVIFILALLGADWATRFQYVVMALLVGALFSFFLGGIPQWQSTTFLANWAPAADPEPFWLVFGIFFPAVTGFTQGVSMSGDLKDPGKSLPLGTFMAVGVSIVIYFMVVIVFAGVLPNTTLVEDYQAIKHVSRYDFLIDAGVIAATLSSAMASFLGGPRILQSLASDKIFPILNIFAKGSSPTNNPRRAVVLTATIALITIMLGQLNMVARIVSMFFLISYGLLNYATWYEAYSNSPAFRPRFRWFNKYLSLAGFVLCFIIIFALDLEYGLVAIAILAAIHQYIKRTSGPSRWADSSRSHALQIIRRELHATSNEPEHDRDWRPHILAFTKNQSRRSLLLHFAEWLSGNSGLITAVKITEGNGLQSRKAKREALQELKDSIAQTGTTAFPLALSGRDITETLITALQAYGIGPLKANTILCNWYDEVSPPFPGLAAMKFGHNLRLAYRHGYNLIVLHADPQRTEHLLEQKESPAIIDIWFQNNASCRLMLLFAYLITRNKLWEKAEIRVLFEKNNDSSTDTPGIIGQLLDDARIPASPHAVDDMKPDSVITMSSTSDLVFMPFRFSHSLLTDVSGYSLERVLTRLPPTIMIMAAENIDLDAEPEEGSAGELALALDELHDVENRLKRAEKRLQKNKELVVHLETQISQLSPEEQAASAQLERQLATAHRAVELSFRKVAKAEVRRDDALDSLKKLAEYEPS